jgi:hypothetical protein
MKKCFLFAALFLWVGGISVEAQLKFGLKTGVGLSRVSLEGPLANHFAVSNLTGFKIGPTLEFRIPLIGLGMETSLLYSQQGFGLTLDDSFAMINGFRSVYDGSHRLNALEIPVRLKHKCSIFNFLGVYGSAGPYVYLRLSDNLREQIKARSYGSGLSFELGVELLGHLQAGIQYQWSITEDYSSVWSRLPSAGLTDVFRGKSKILSASLTCLF